MPAEEPEIEEAETDEEKLIECAECGCECTLEESLGAETGKKGEWEDVCRECYGQIVSTCQLCGDEDVMPSDESEFVLFKAELADVPGIYRIMSRPFLLQPLIGSTSLFDSSVLFVARLPQCDEHYEISGHLCKKCARPYQQKYAEAYPQVRWMLKRYGPEMRGIKCGTPAKTRRAKWRRIINSPFSKVGYSIRNRHLRKVILANPDMLRDLECDRIAIDADGDDLPGADDSPWADLKQRLNLPDLPTYHEWVFVEHRGVKVYSVCSKDSDGDSWMTWHPEPRFRNYGHGPDVFSIGSLPNYKKHKAAYVEEDALRTQDLFKDIVCNELKYWRERQQREGVEKPDDLEYWRKRAESSSYYQVVRDIGRAVTREAIELGYIRQDGVFDEQGQPAHYR